MKIFGLQVQRAKKAQEFSSETQFRQSSPQGWMTSYFQDYYLRKVSGEFYEFLREGIPIIDSAIGRLISLNGTVKIIGDKADIVKELEDFCLNVPVNDMQKGIHAFMQNASNETFEQGFALAEFITTKDLKDIAGLRVADSKDIIFRKNTEGKAEPWYRYPGNVPSVTFSNPQSLVQRILTATYGQSVYVNGMMEEKLNPENKLYFSINNENNNPYGVSIMRSMEFVSKILMTMQDALLNVWERFGDPSFHIKYKTSKKDGVDLEARRQKLSTDFTAAVKAKREGKSADFVNAVDINSDIEISIIGSDGKELSLEVPSRHVLEQIVSKVNLPAWMLGLYWSTTERMATLEVESALQDSKIRQFAMLPEYIRFLSVVLKLRGHKWSSVTTDPNKPGDWGIMFETPNLHDIVAQAQARFLNAQADIMVSGKNPSTSQTNMNIGGASYEINGMKFPLSLLKTVGVQNFEPLPKEKECKCGAEHLRKELNRPVPWPELDRIEVEYENELKFDWGELKDNIFKILQLPDETGIKAIKKDGPSDNIPPEDAFTFSDEQRKRIFDSLKGFVGLYDLQDADSAIKWYYGRAFSVGILQAVNLIGETRPILDVIKNREVYDELTKTGFQLIKDNSTLAIKDQIIPAMEDGMTQGVNPKDVARDLEKLFGNKNSDWERLARSEMSMAAGTGKLREWEQWDVKNVEFTPAPDACEICLALAGDYEIKSCPLPNRDTHPRFRCAIRPASSEV